EAQAMGLVNRAVAEGELEAFTRSYCATLAENAPLSIAASKEIIAELVKPCAEMDRAKCEALATRCMESEDFAEGRRAFAEKRAALRRNPRFPCSASRAPRIWRDPSRRTASPARR